MLLLVVPLRDFREKVAKERIQRDFEEHLRRGIEADTTESSIFVDLIEGGAGPNIGLKTVSTFKTLLQLSAHGRNEDLVRYLQKKDVEDKGSEEQCYNPSRHRAQ
ncbi:hypothetical protein B0H14DRAFT_2629328 [Mycena olivaceomarginata]|nr:hypothetical protein B0H14DRAFT_2629328 [Mycena olivaceomarginata]